ncbi:SdiA-regulated domain-containing protein [Hahella sp. CR1]|uniref:SdiA-regulated domain-containing protein n=1 Tax=Hahella sp. CR1 TaxID=2992807 RepID=UPI002441AA00|nr:SdiA-regulated domain-containing protein [Hahella sp. CR1]MDG9669027.1 SdiA-regulated domain-containing protein [Hahella sp. CR1]
MRRYSLSCSHIFARPFRHFMARKPGLTLLLAASIHLSAQAEPIEISLQFTELHSVKNKAQGLTEPSGLTLDANGGLWTVSDDTAKLFLLDHQGQVLKSIEAPASGFEGVAYDPEHRRLIAVKEESNAFFIFDLASGEPVAQRRLSDFEDFAQSATFFAQTKENKGLEGIAWNPADASIYAIKEGDPGVLLHLSGDLSKVISSVKLVETGVSDDDIALDDIDYSGLTVIPEHNLLAIVSDKAARIYFYDLTSGRVKSSAALTKPGKKPGKLKPVRKAEGVAYDPASQSLYVISDKDAELYVYKVVISE